MVLAKPDIIIIYLTLVQSNTCLETQYFTCSTEKEEIVATCKQKNFVLPKNIVVLAKPWFKI
jgi:hypothetical protein